VKKKRKTSSEPHIPDITRAPSLTRQDATDLKFKKIKVSQPTTNEPAPPQSSTPSYDDSVTIRADPPVDERLPAYAVLGTLRFKKKKNASQPTTSGPAPSQSSLPGHDESLTGRTDPPGAKQSRPAKKTPTSTKKIVQAGTERRRARQYGLKGPGRPRQRPREPEGRPNKRHCPTFGDTPNNHVYRILSLSEANRPQRPASGQQDAEDQSLTRVPTEQSQQTIAPSNRRTVTAQPGPSQDIPPPASAILGKRKEHHGHAVHLKHCSTESAPREYAKLPNPKVSIRHILAPDCRWRGPNVQDADQNLKDAINTAISDHNPFSKFASQGWELYDEAQSDHEDPFPSAQHGGDKADSILLTPQLPFHEIKPTKPPLPGYPPIWAHVILFFSFAYFFLKSCSSS